MSKKLTKKAVSTFESIKEVDINGNEYWNSRKLAKVLEYADYRNFITVVGKAKEACLNSGIPVNVRGYPRNDSDRKWCRTSR